MADQTEKESQLDPKTVPGKLPGAVDGTQYFHPDVLDGFPCPIWRSSPDKKCDYFNRAWLDFTGRTLEQELGDGWTEGIHPLDFARSFKTYSEAFDNRRVFEMECRLRTHDGEYRSINHTGRPFQDHAGNFSGYIGACFDLSQRQHLENSLFDAQTRTESILASIADLHILFDREWRYVYANKAATQAIGQTREQLLGRTLWEVYPDIIGTELDRQYRRAMAERAPVAFDFYYPTTQTWWEYRVFPAPEGLAVFATEITDRRKSLDALQDAERKYRDIFENAREGIFQTTLEGRFITANPALARMLGFNSPAELIAARTDLAREHYVNPQRREEFKQLLNAYGFVANFESEAFKKDSSRIWISENVRAVRDRNGAVLYFEGTTQDITERKRAEARSAAFASLARKLSGARTQLEAGRIIAETARDLFGWDACNLDLYDAERNRIQPILNVDTIAGELVNFTPSIEPRTPTTRSRRVIEDGPQLTLRAQPSRFDRDDVPFGDKTHPSVSIMTAPVRHAAKVIGLFSIQSYSQRAYDEAALKDLEDLADHCGEALNRIHAEQSLRESEERFRQMAEHFEDVIWMADKDLDHVLYINPAYERVFGRSCESIYERLGSFLEAVHPEDRASVEQMLERERSGQHEPFEYRIVRPDGSVRWILRRSFPIRDNEGQVLRMAGIGQDVTERKRAEAEVRQSEERYRDLVENSRELIFTHDLNGLILSANRAAVEVLGYDPKEFSGKRNFRDILAPEVRDQFDEYLERIRRDGVASGLTLVQTSSGEHRLLEYHNTVRTEGVAAPVVRGMARDITEQRRAEQALRASEERYRELFENAKDPIYVHDLSGRYVSVNRATEKLSGYRREEIIGKHFSNFVAPAHLKYVRENLCKKLDDAGETAYEVDIITRDRRRVPVEIVSRLICENGVPVGVQGTARDVTERKRAQEALRTFSQRLIEVQEAERQHIARELHDQIGQVLTAIRLNLQAVQSSCQTDACLPHVDESLSIIDDALARVRELSLELRPSLLDDLGLASALRWYVDRYAQRTGIAAEVVNGFEENGRLPRDLETVCFRIAQEALTNVARHAQAKHVYVELRHGSKELFLTIRDDGVGFDVASLTGNASSDSALGLRGMRERARAVRGVIEINSALNAGTLVFASFPMN